MIAVRWLIGAITLLFTARRSFYWLASFRRARPCVPNTKRSVTVVIPARNEERMLPRLLAALERLEYPTPLINFILVDDGSTDGTGQLFMEWARARRNARMVQLPESSGKAAALMAGAALAAPADLVAIFDADTEPAPDSLAWLAGAFDDPNVGAAGGYSRPGNAERSVTSRYAALERWVCHLVTLAGKDRLAQNPPVLGAICAFRRRALEEVGSVPPEAVSEDVWISMKLTSTGWKTRWIGQAIAREDVAEELETFWRQRIRWSRGQLAARRVAGRAEDFLVAAGYLDRIAAVVAVVLVLTGFLPLWVPAVYALVPVATMVTAAYRARARRVPAYLLAVVAMIVADVGVTVASIVAQLRGRPHIWVRKRLRAARESEAA
jgi:cellulose synthase/poly-beta-1,6-N-acetylglucosamine synthase-like glycosyltransferase